VAGNHKEQSRELEIMAELQITFKKAWLLHCSLMTTAMKVCKSGSTASGTEILSVGGKNPTVFPKYYTLTFF